jgi:cytochrome c oxidase subunit 4
MNEISDDGARPAVENRTEEPLAHILSPRVLLSVWGALVILTGITIGASRMDLGAIALWVALAIATVKASLVVLYFMHLRYDRPIYAVILIAALLLVLLFIGLALTDTQSYEPDLIPGYAPAMPK